MKNTWLVLVIVAGSRLRDYKRYFHVLIRTVLNTQSETTSIGQCSYPLLHVRVMNCNHGWRLVPWRSHRVAYYSPLCSVWLLSPHLLFFPNPEEKASLMWASPHPISNWQLLNTADKRDVRSKHWRNVLGSGFIGRHPKSRTVAKPTNKLSIGFGFWENVRVCDA